MQSAASRDDNRDQWYIYVKTFCQAFHGHSSPAQSLVKAALVFGQIPGLCITPHHDQSGYAGSPSSMMGTGVPLISFVVLGHESNRKYTITAFIEEKKYRDHSLTMQIQ